MPPAELQRLFGFASEYASTSHAILRRRQEHMPVSMANPLDDAVELQSTKWESLWIDVGGEG